MLAKTPGVWQECGRIYRCRASGFSKRVVSTKGLARVIVMSMKSMLGPCFVKVQYKLSFRIALVKAVQFCQLIDRSGSCSQMARVLLMK